MNLVELQNKLLAAARANPPSDRVPFAFEQRIMARLKAQPALDECALWARALWRAAAPCVALTLMLAGWAAFTPARHMPSTDLSQEIENTVLAAVDQEPPADSTW
jgi:anti-sigma-K factor RskA